ncbi:hypothetical protein Syun_015701 [Stephania yunnanensis]|uniref:Uncharacterized protein n=1 Tax=Stephania yunnanensis TaxID=152371 RepID=A0AAP0JLN9_9MAGN
MRHHCWFSKPLVANVNDRLYGETSGAFVACAIAVVEASVVLLFFLSCFRNLGFFVPFVGLFPLGGVVALL